MFPISNRKTFYLCTRLFLSMIGRNCRRTVILLSLTGFFLIGILDATFLISIVAMIKPTSSNEPILNNLSPKNIRLDWTESQKNSILGSFIWGNLIGQIPVARMSEIFGPKRVIGWCTFISSILTIAMPFGAQLQFWLAWFMRFCIGATLFSMLTCIETVGVRWFSPLERAKLMAKSVTKTLGEAFAFLCSGYIIAYFGWPVLFYICGSLGVIWTLAWWYLMYDSPHVHPWISIEEKEKVLASLGTKTGRGIKDLPLKEMLSNKSVWALFISFIFGCFSLFTYCNYMTIFMTNVLHFSIEENGVLSCFHLIAFFLFGVSGSYVSTWLIKSKTLSVTTVRKLFTSVAQITAGILIVSLLVFNNSRAYCASALVLAFGVNGLCYSGSMVNAMDLAPNFAASITSIALFIGGITGWMGTRIVNATVSVDNSFESWKPMLICLAMGYFLACPPFILFGSGDVQPFNYHNNHVKSEREKLNK